VAILVGNFPAAAGKPAPAGYQEPDLPKQNRPLVRDGRLQAPKKRTDRSYLRTPEAPPMPETPEEGGEALETVDEAVRAPAPPTPEPAKASAAPARRYAAAPPPAARAIQQQGVRKRRDFDLNSLAERDTRYAMHELRRIFVLATIVIVTLIVLGIVLR
jgi:hypothetical protein